MIINAPGASHNRQHVVRTQPVDLLSDSHQVCDQLVPPLGQLNHHRFQPSSQDGFEARLLVDPRPNHISGLEIIIIQVLICRTHFASGLVCLRLRRQRARARPVATGTKKQPFVLSIPDLSLKVRPFLTSIAILPSEKVKEHRISESVDDGAASCLGLNLCEITTATHTMAKTIVAPVLSVSISGAEERIILCDSGALLCDDCFFYCSFTVNKCVKPNSRTILVQNLATSEEYTLASRSPTPQLPGKLLLSI